MSYEAPSSEMPANFSILKLSGYALSISLYYQKNQRLFYRVSAHSSAHPLVCVI